MANADRHHMGPASRGKGSGTGAMTELPEGVLEENMVLSNRDKSLHSDARGLDSRTVQTEQYRDHSANRRDFDAQAGDGAGNASGLGAPDTNTSAEDSSQDRA
jgi:hypothetical protein